MGDLEWLRENGLDEAVRGHARAGLVVGICGGMQMLGKELADPGGVERQGSMLGLGLLPISTTMQAEKVTRLCTGTIHGGSLFGQPIQTDRISGYEIHVGKTDYLAQAEPFATLASGELDGCVSADRRILGTYLHGIFDEDCFRHQFVTAARSFYKLASPSVLQSMEPATPGVSRSSRSPGKRLARHASHLCLGRVGVPMTLAKTIAAAYLLDWIAGDPEWFPHPVRLIGQSTQLAESRLRRPGQSAEDELLVGAALTFAVIGVSYLVTAKAIDWAHRANCGAGIAAEILLGWTCLATRDLVDQSRAVIQALEQENLPQARLQTG